MYKILAINPGSTSTKISVYNDENVILEKNIAHTEKELSKFENIIEQLHWRKSLIENTLLENKIDIKKISAIASRGGMMKPIESGTYLLTNEILDDIKSININGHASNLAAFIADSMANELGIKAYIVDPVVVDEMSDLARITGLAEIKRISRFHALNQKAIAYEVAKDIGKPYNEINLIIAHLGGGISIGAHLKGRVVDVNDALEGDGPLSPNRCGCLPAGELIRLCFSGKYTEQELIKMITNKSGVLAHLGTNQMKDIEEQAIAGNTKAKFILDVMCYQVSKNIGALATVLEGDIDAIVLTGGIVRGEYVKNEIIKRVSFISKVLVYAGEEEMKALTYGVLRVLRGEEKPKTY